MAVGAAGAGLGSPCREHSLGKAPAPACSAGRKQILVFTGKCALGLSLSRPSALSGSTVCGDHLQAEVTSAGRGDISTLMRRALVKLSLKAGLLHSRHEKEPETRGVRARLAFKPLRERLEHLWLLVNFGCFGEGKVLEMLRESLSGGCRL